jgi:mono/diheme cytochrome c family protein
MIDRGAYLVRTVALCGGCHTAAGGAELAGNAKFKGGKLPAPNLTSDATGLGSWTDQQIMNAFRNGVDDEGRHLDKAMPYWMFHNMTDSDAMAIVAFLRSLPHISNKVNDAAVGESNPDAATVASLSPADFPNTSLPTTDGNYAAAQTGKYLLSSVAGCVRCHSPSSAGLPAQQFFSGVAPTSGTQIFSSNITPDATGIAGWTAADVAAALKVGTRGDGSVLCGSMPSGTKGYGGLTDADATAIGIYLTTIPGVANAAAEPSLEPPCP